MRQMPAVLCGILLWVASSGAAPHLELSGVHPSFLVTRGGAAQPMLLANEQLFLQCLPTRGHWSADSTRLSLQLPASGIALRADGEDLAWADGDHRFASALHLRGEELTLVARAGTLRIQGERAQLLTAPPRLSRRENSLGGRVGWILSALMGLLVAGSYFRGRLRH